MAEPLKNHFGPDVPVRIADMLASVDRSFPSRAFVRDALDGYEDLELTPRAWHIARALGRHLPEDYARAAEIIVGSMGPPLDEAELTGMEPFVYLPYVLYVAERGLGDWDVSMWAQYELTQRFSAEYSIRAFLEREQTRTLERLREWTADPSQHVRRLVSEGTRPRLPWAPRLRGFQADPAPVIELLELLKDDPARYVRRSVANNLNDIGKDHPELLVEVCRRWSEDASDDRRWIVRRALRSAVKRGDPGALAVLGFDASARAQVDGVRLAPKRPRIGGRVHVEFSVRNPGRNAAKYAVDLRVHFVKANGTSSPKVFKVKEIDLEPGAAVELGTSISLAQHSTRTHHPGRHELEILVNGTAHPAGVFTLLGAQRSPPAVAT